MVEILTETSCFFPPRVWVGPHKNITYQIYVTDHALICVIGLSEKSKKKKKKKKRKKKRSGVQFVHEVQGTNIFLFFVSCELSVRLVTLFQH